MLTQCTHPLAPFYQIDSILLTALESRGADMPCDVLAGVSAGLAGVALSLAALAAFGLIRAALALLAD